MKKIVVTLLLFISFIGYSQTNGITYQAVILNPSGDQLPGVNNTNAPLANKYICLKFSIIDQNSQFEYIETVQTTTDEFGMVNLIIGTGDQIGGYATSFSTILWNANPKSLKVDLSTTGVCSYYTEISNQPFTAVPFALFAANSESTAALAALQATVAANATATTAALALKEDAINKSTTTTLGTSNVLFPTQNAVKTYVDSNIATVNANNTALEATVAANATAASNAIAAVQADVNQNEADGDAADVILQNNITTLQNTVSSNATTTTSALGLKEDAANKSTTTTLGNSDVLFPTQNAVKTYVDSQISSSTIADADATTKGKIQLAGDLAGTAAAPVVAANAITTSKILDANVTDAKIATVSGSKVTGNITGSAANVTGIVPVANGGTGQTTISGVKSILGLSGTNVAIGAASGTTNQGAGAVGVGNGTGQTNQGSQSVAIGYVAGNSNQGANSVAIGSNAAQGGQGTQSVAIGIAANSSANNATAVGGFSSAGHTNATAIGYQAVTSGSNTIQLGADGVTIPGSTAITNVKTSGTLTAGAVTYPNTHGSTGQVLSTTGSGTLTWAAPNASSLSGTVAVANGGTGATTATGALTNLGAAPLASPTFTGTPAAPTATAGSNTTQIATTEFVTGAVALATITDATTTAKGKLQLAGDLAGTADAPTVPGLALKAPLASPTFTGAVTAPIYASTPQVLTDAATIDWNPTNGLNASVTLGGNRTLSFTTMPAVGSYGTLIVTQDATGSRTITLPSTSNKVLGSSSTTTIALSTAANANDILNFYYDGTNCYWNIGQGYGSAAPAVITNLTTGVSGTLPVANGGSGAATLTGYIKGNGTSAMTANASIPVADVTGAAPLASPTFTGTPIAPTATAGSNTTQIATTEFVTGAVALATITDATTTAKGKLQLAGDLAGTADAPTVPGLALKAPLASPTFTGTVTAPIYASTPQALTDAATIDWNPASGLNASVTLGGNRTLSFSSTPAVGSYGTLIVSQDATGGRTINLPSTSNKVLGSTSTTTIALSSAANAKDILNFYYDGTNCYWNIGQGYGTATPAVITNLATGVSGTLPVANGGSGAATLTGYIKGNGTSAMTANASIPVADVTGAAPIASPTFTGTPIAPTASAGTNTTQIATTEFVTGAVALATITDATTTAKGKLQLAGDLAGTADAPTVPGLALKAPLASPTFTGAVTAPIYASTPQALTDAATIVWNPINGLNASVTLGGNRTLSFSSTPAVGSYGTLVVSQDATGGRTITLPSTSNKVLGSTSTTTITLSSAANAKDILNFYYDGTNCYWNIGQGYGTATTVASTNLTSSVSGTLPIANGGTGATTKATAFDALSPMTSSGDIIYGGLNGTGTRLSKGSNGSILTMENDLPTWNTSIKATPGSSYNAPVGFSFIGGDWARNTGMFSDNPDAGGLATLKFRIATSNSIANSYLEINPSKVSVLPTTASTSKTTGALTVAGGLGVNGDIYTNNLNASGTVTAGSVTYPNAHGTANQVLSTTGSGTLTWTTPSTYLLPTASASALGGVKVGSNLSVDGTGVLSTIAAPTFTGAVTAPIYASTPQTLNDADTISWNPANGLNASVTLGGNRTLSFSSTPAVGSYGTLVVSQDATGGRTITLPSTSNKVLGSTSTTTITLSSAANAKDILNFYYDGTNCYWNVGQGYGTAATVASTNLTSSVSGTLPIANGGTGATSLTVNNVLLGNGTSALQEVAPGTSGNILTSNGTTWISSAPAASGVPYTGATQAVNLGAYDLTVNGLTVGKGRKDTGTAYQYNSAFGVSALGSFTGGTKNTALGFNALSSVTSTDQNIAIGAYAMGSTTADFQQSVAVGNQSLQYNKGSFNTALGSGALSSINLTSAATYLVGVGALALNNNSTGQNNTAVGSYALSTNTTGNNNTALGQGADVSSANLTNATAIGYNARVGTSNTIQLGNTFVTNVNTSGAITAKNYITTVPANITAATTTVLDFSTGNILKVSLGANITTLSVTNATAGTYLLEIIQGGTYTVAFPAAWKWSGGLAPTITATSGKTDIITIVYDGSTYFASAVQNF